MTCQGGPRSSETGHSRPIPDGRLRQNIQRRGFPRFRIWHGHCGAGSTEEQDERGGHQDRDREPDQRRQRPHDGPCGREPPASAAHQACACRGGLRRACRRLLCPGAGRQEPVAARRAADHLHRDSGPVRRFPAAARARHAFGHRLSGCDRGRTGRAGAGRGRRDGEEGPDAGSPLQCRAPAFGAGSPDGSDSADQFDAQPGTGAGAEPHPQRAQCARGRARREKGRAAISPRGAAGAPGRSPRRRTRPARGRAPRARRCRWCRSVRPRLHRIGPARTVPTRTARRRSPCCSTCPSRRAPP